MVAGALALCMATASAQGVDQYEYEKDRIYPVRTGSGLTTQIELDPKRSWTTAPVSAPVGS